MDLISFIIPVKDESKYIIEALDAVRISWRSAYEVIIIDDHSTDDTFEKVSCYCQTFEQFKVFKNPDKGKVAGLNFGFKKSKGDFIKCIDGDDVISDQLYKEFSSLDKSQVFCHSYYITDESLRVNSVYNMNTTFFKKDFKNILENCISLPRCIWTFPRCIGNKIFPMPLELPFEDVWFSMIIKRYAEINYLSQPLYYYRQNEGQTFGGVFNRDQEVIKFRARRMLTVINVLSSSLQERFRFNGEVDFQAINTYYEVIAKDKILFREIIFSKMKFQDKMKALLQRKLYFILPLSYRLKWAYDKIIS